MKAEIITIGDEILIGQIIDTNSAWMGQQLEAIGVKVHQITSVSDSPEHIKVALDNALKAVDLVLFSGGLGPTKDDLTKKTLADYFNSKLVKNEDVLADIKQFLQQKNRYLNERNIEQALVPEKCTVIRNFNGTAPAMWFETNGKVVVSMPGVPWEMKDLMSGQILPKIKNYFQTPTILHRTILTYGLPESLLAQEIEEWENNLPHNIKLAYLPSPERIRLRMSVSGNNDQELKQLLDEKEAELHQYIHSAIFGHDDESLQQVVGNYLKKHNQTLATAESCTGGYIAHLFTAMPGSSAFFKGSVVAYSNEIKQNLLGVTQQALINNGAVSQEVVEQMAVGVRKLLNTSFAIAVSGIAGPEGGTAEKPVGTVWIAIASENEVHSKIYQFGNKRDINIRLAASTAIDKLRKHLMGLA